MSWILSYGCTTAAGSGSEALFASLLSGADHRTQLDPSQWPGQTLVKAPTSFRALRWPASTPSSAAASQTQRELLLSQILISWNEAKCKLSAATRARLESGRGLGVILASTKSFVDDFIWETDPTEAEKALNQDALKPLLDDFLKATGLRASRSTAVSNACASSLSALALAEVWLKDDAGSSQSANSAADSKIEDVIVIAADAVGPFVVRGFETLRVLTTDTIRSFSSERSGFHLGEASAALVLSKHPEGEAPISLRGVGIDAEGFAVTRPSQSGDSLKRACLAIPNLQKLPPDLIVAHGTGTKVNDQIEDRVYHDVFGSLEAKPWVTGAKWCVGHTLGACGAIDLIAGMEILKTQKAFRLVNTPQASSDFQCRYLTASTEPSKEISNPIRRVLVSSLGFGGIHASTLVELPERAGERAR